MAILLIGNGLNQLTKCAPNWVKLLGKAAWDQGISDVSSLSMSMGYEKLEARASGKSSLEIKRGIADDLRRQTEEKLPLPAKSILREFLSLPVTEILTTNYDYVLEMTLEPSFVPARTTHERLYSRERTRHAGDKLVTHIHGECRYPESICLGFEHYAGTLEKTRSLLTCSTSVKDKSDPHRFALYDYLNQLGNDQAYKSWLFRFFSEDIYIVGFGLDMSEIDIWWLLSYRAKLIREGKVPVANHIVYYETDSDVKNKHRLKDIKEKQELLEAFNTEVKSIMGRGYLDKYKQILKDIQCRLDHQANRTD